MRPATSSSVAASPKVTRSSRSASRSSMRASRSGSCKRFRSSLKEAPMKRFNLSEWAVHDQALVLFLILAIGVGGVLSIRSLGRAEDPNVTIKNVIVTAIWPGATAQEMQNQVSDRIEKRLQELPWFDKVVTYTKPGFTAMNVGFRDNTPPREVPQLFYQLRKKLADIRGELPGDLIGPNVNDEYGDVDS